VSYLRVFGFGVCLCAAIALASCNSATSPAPQPAAVGDTRAADEAAIVRRKANEMNFAGDVVTLCVANDPLENGDSAREGFFDPLPGS